MDDVYGCLGSILDAGEEADVCCAGVAFPGDGVDEDFPAGFIGDGDAIAVL
jgi:hypothetical protein